MSAPSSLPALSAPKIRPPINPVRGFSIPCPSHIAPGHTSQWILLLVFLRLKVTLPYSQLLTASPNLLTLLLFPNSPQLERLLTSLSSMCFVCMVCLLMLSLTGVPNSSPKSGRLSARPLGASASLSSGYHPQSNGQTERTNQELETALRCVVSANPV